MKFFIMQFSPASCYLLSSRPKHSPWVTGYSTETVHRLGSTQRAVIWGNAHLRILWGALNLDIKLRKVLNGGKFTMTLLT
jgi:hypothetical protein